MTAIAKSCEIGSFEQSVRTFPIAADKRECAASAFGRMRFTVIEDEACVLDVGRRNKAGE